MVLVAMTQHESGPLGVFHTSTFGVILLNMDQDAKMVPKIISQGPWWEDSAESIMDLSSKLSAFLPHQPTSASMDVEDLSYYTRYTNIDDCEDSLWRSFSSSQVTISDQWQIFTSASFKMTKPCGLS